MRKNNTNNLDEIFIKHTMFIYTYCIVYHTSVYKVCIDIFIIHIGRVYLMCNRVFHSVFAGFYCNIFIL